MDCFMWPQRLPARYVRPHTDFRVILTPPSVMIVSYETLRTLSTYLANCTIGLLLCDEGHRLKNAGTTVAFVIHGLAADQTQSPRHSKLSTG